ncbi:hypothetical protein BC792_10736 [Sphingobacterium allocomposti]|uniref:Uncharacterized protein n=2 Tax=Sphingobacterium allocomposti TaxID=415956 RepID=A0A5S5DJR3_9SPHI|nr:hypothetical protein BC792_10736 [Sphingobacterium composti Yoo et al. 2007 non Ten et al. 2007]
MTKRTKAIFLGLCIIGSFLIYCVFYYSNMIKNAPYRFADFEYVKIQYGLPDSMLNSYNSATQEYQYLNKNNEVVKKKLKLTDDDLLYLHRKAMEMGFWNVDNDMTTPREDASEGHSVPRYILEYKYKEKGKKVTLDADYPGNQKMKDAAKTTIEKVLDIINVADAR